MSPLCVLAERSLYPVTLHRHTMLPVTTGGQERVLEVLVPYILLSCAPALLEAQQLCET